MPESGPQSSINLTDIHLSGDEIILPSGKEQEYAKSDPIRKEVIDAVESIKDELYFQRSSLLEQIRNNKYAFRAIVVNGAINGLLSAATLFLTIYTRDLAVSTRDLRDAAIIQLDATKKGLEKIDDSIRVSQRQAIASEDANAIARLNISRQLRAYIVEEGIHLDGIATNEMVSKIVVKNVGQTPSYNLSFFANSSIVKRIEGNVVVPSHMKDFCNGGSIGQFTLGVNDDATFVVPRTNPMGETVQAYSKKDLEELTRGISVYVVWGELCYRDIFGSSRFTKFCRFYDGLVNLSSNTQTTCATDNEVEPLSSPTYRN